MPYVKADIGIIDIYCQSQLFSRFPAVINGKDVEFILPLMVVPMCLVYINMQKAHVHNSIIFPSHLLQVQNSLHSRELKRITTGYN
jgi:hypothetical protein